MAAPELFTGRLILRSFRETDIEAVFRIFSDETVNRFLPWFPLKTMAEAKTFFLKTMPAAPGTDTQYASGKTTSP